MQFGNRRTDKVEAHCVEHHDTFRARSGDNGHQPLCRTRSSESLRSRGLRHSECHRRRSAYEHIPQLNAYRSHSAFLLVCHRQARGATHAGDILEQREHRAAALGAGAGVV